MADEVAGGVRAGQHRCTPMRGCDAAADFAAIAHCWSGVQMLDATEEAAALIVAAVARGWFVSGIAGDTASATVGIGEADNARNSVSAMGRRPAHARERSRDRAGQRGYRPLRNRPWPDYMDRPGKESAAAGSLTYLWLGIQSDLLELAGVIPVSPARFIL